MQLDNDLLDLWLVKMPTQAQMRVLIETCQTLRDEMASPTPGSDYDLRNKIEDLEDHVRELGDENRRLREDLDA